MAQNIYKRVNGLSSSVNHFGTTLELVQMHQYQTRCYTVYFSVQFSLTTVQIYKYVIDIYVAYIALSVE